MNRTESRYIKKNQSGNKICSLKNEMRERFKSARCEIEKNRNRERDTPRSKLYSSNSE